MEKQGGKEHPQLVDSGSDREIVGRRYAVRHGLKTKALARPVQLRYMNGEISSEITHATWQKFFLPGTNGVVRFHIKYLIADIPEGFVLGLSWLRYANPDIDWPSGTIRWRNKDIPAVDPAPLPDTPPATIIYARKARDQIIASDIAANEPPDWVKTKHPMVLDTSERGLPPLRGDMDYRIEMKPGFVPKRQPNRSYSQAEMTIFREMAEKEVAAGRWRVGNGPQAVQMLLAAKAGGEKRPCHDYRPINPFIIDDAFPIPNMKDLMRDIAGCLFLTSLDLPKAYNKVRLADKRTEDLLAFICAGMLYAPRVMQFGSKTAVSHYQRFILSVLGDVIGRGVLAYLDNIVIYASTQAEHDRLLSLVLTRLEENDLTIQPKKCEWSKNEVQFCGFMIGEQGIRLDPEKLRAIRDWEPPAKEGGALARTHLRGFIGFVNFYKDGIDHFSDIAAPLTDLQSPLKEWKWGDREQNAFETLKKVAMTAPLRAAFRFGIPVEMHTDASNEAIAATIEHRYACGHTQPIAFYSRKLNKAERNYNVHDRELMAIRDAFRSFHSWLHGSPKPVKVYSDHKALEHFLHTTKLTQRHARWAEELGEYTFQIQHVPGRENGAADGLSRQYAETTEEKNSVTVLKPEHFARMVVTHTTAYAGEQINVSHKRSLALR